MSFFYLSAARGDMQLHVLEACARRRLAHLAALLAAPPAAPAYCEYVVEGGLYDNAGHHALALAGALGGARLARLVRRGELELFRRRLAALPPPALRAFAGTLVKQLGRAPPHPARPAHLACLLRLCRTLMLKPVARHVGDPHAPGCTLHCVTERFAHCLPLVAARQVDIVNGEAKIYCGQWRRYLLHLFDTQLLSRMSSNSNLTLLKSDPRVMEMVSTLLQFSASSELTSSNILRSSNTDAASKYFPPCMQNLHRTVRKHHRLSHYQRFQYSLFLKDIGMPVSEAIDFWRAEYQRPSGTDVCCHSWAKDEKKYIYGIRHLYGLEGGRKSYSSVSCSRIQATAGAMSEGGCPFKNFDMKNMTRVLNANFVNSPDCMSQLNQFKSGGNCLKACKFYLSKLYPNENCDKNALNFFDLNPVKFYKLAVSKSVTK